MQGSRRIALNLTHPRRTLFGTAIAVVVLDQVSKALVRSYMGPGSSVPLIRGFFELTYVRNIGAAFGLFPGRQPVFIMVSVAVLVGVAIYWRRARPSEWPIVIALALIFGGSLGNLIDRAGVGKVTDFFYFSFIDFPVFNVADIAIVGGAGLLMAWLLFGPVPVKPSTAIDDVPDAEEVDSP